MLIYAVSLAFQLPAYMIIHNQCLNIELVSSIYFSNDVICHDRSGQKIDIGAKIRTSLEIDTIKDKFEGVLLFRLKRHVESDNQHNMNTSITEANKNEATNVHMLIIWEVKNAKFFCICSISRICQRIYLE
jgi:hypothetical protein